MLRQEQVDYVIGRDMGEGGLLVYDLDAMSDKAQLLQDTDLPYGLTVRYAAKANDLPAVVSNFDRAGLSFLAASRDEASYLIAYGGVDPSKVSLSSKVLRDDPGTRSLFMRGVLPDATSLRQIGVLGKMGAELEDRGFDSIGVRVNLGYGEGGNPQTSTAGPESSHGIWKDLVPDIREEAEASGLKIDRLHIHVGSAVDPEFWGEVIRQDLEMVEEFPDVTTLNTGGGYKIDRMHPENDTDMREILGIFAAELAAFRASTGRELHVEIEPGTWLVAQEGTAYAHVEEVTRTTPENNQVTLSLGMNAAERISRYGALHPITVLNDSLKRVMYAFFGPNCETGDCLTLEEDNPRKIVPREFNEAEVGDTVRIGGVGAYCLTMSPVQYNRVPPPVHSAVSGRELDRTRPIGYNP
jgi:diaminopimelate decarboxylase